MATSLNGLLDRGGTVHLLVRAGSESKFEALQQRMEARKDRLFAVEGNLLDERLGVSDACVQELSGNIDHFIHLAAVYDLMLDDEEAQSTVNVGGTRHALQAADAMEAGCFHHMSSIAVAGLYKGFWQEDMFDDADQYRQPYFRTKREAEFGGAQRVLATSSDLPPWAWWPGTPRRAPSIKSMARIICSPSSRKFARPCRRGCRSLAWKAAKSTLCRWDYVADAFGLSGAPRWTRRSLFSSDRSKAVSRG